MRSLRCVRCCTQRMRVRRRSLNADKASSGEPCIANIWASTSASSSAMDAPSAMLGDVACAASPRSTTRPQIELSRTISSMERNGLSRSSRACSGCSAPVPRSPQRAHETGPDPVPWDLPLLGRRDPHNSKDDSVRRASPGTRGARRASPSTSLSRRIDRQEIASSPGRDVADVSCQRRVVGWTNGSRRLR